MILYYAMGGGLGHLARARAVLHTLGLSERATVLSACPGVADRRVVGALRTTRVPATLQGDTAAYRAWLAAWLAEHRPEAIFLDTFPAGIRGEFCDFAPLAGIPLTWVARLLRWPAYAAQLRGRPPRLERVLAVEPPSDGQGAWLRAQGLAAEPLALADPPYRPHAALRRALDRLGAGARPPWLVVHSGPSAEVRALAEWAERERRAEAPDARLVVVSASRTDGLPAGAERLDLYPAAALFPLAERLFTACGFNAMRQAAPFRARHRFHPFDRRFDDQPLRAERALAGGCGH